MNRTRRPTRAVWIALLAMAALVFGPTVSRAIAASAPAATAHAHCEGMATADAPDEGPAAHDPLAHCGLCAVAALPVLHSVPAAAVHGTAARAADASPLQATASQPRPIRSNASPRGPPIPVA